MNKQKTELEKLIEFIEQQEIILNHPNRLYSTPELVKQTIKAIKNKIIAISKQRNFNLEKEIEIMREFAKQQQQEPNEDILYGFQLGYRCALKL